MLRRFIIVAAVLLSFQIKYSFGCRSSTTPAPTPCTYEPNPSGCTDENKAMISDLYVSTKPRTLKPTVYANWTLSDSNCKGTNQTICFTSSTEMICKSVNMTVTELEIELESCGVYIVSAYAASCGKKPGCSHAEAIVSVFAEPWISNGDVVVECGKIRDNFKDPCGVVTGRRMTYTGRDSKIYTLTSSSSESEIEISIEILVRGKFACPLEYELSYFHPDHGLTSYNQSMDCSFIGVQEGSFPMLDWREGDCILISSVNYPADYENNLNLFVNASANTSHSVLFVSILDVTFADEGDKLEIYKDGEVITVDIDNPPDAYAYRADEIGVHFTSDATGTARGFAAIIMTSGY